MHRELVYLGKGVYGPASEKPQPSWSPRRDSPGSPHWPRHQLEYTYQQPNVKPVYVPNLLSWAAAAAVGRDLAVIPNGAAGIGWDTVPPALHH
eukprot:COSAG05_NODE_10230_length_576_cov_1.463312_1_plen_92_part_01